MNEIKVLCPGGKCNRCRRMISRIEEATNMPGVEATIEIIDSMDEILTYHTWILPTLVVNKNMVARGYVPSLQQILNHINGAHSITNDNTIEKITVFGKSSCNGII